MKINVDNFLTTVKNTVTTKLLKLLIQLKDETNSKRYKIRFLANYSVIKEQYAIHHNFS